MDWKFFPPTQARINDEERSQKINRISMDQLFHNLDALLKRDINDCLSKHLGGLLKNNAAIYQVRASVQRRERRDYFEAGKDGEEAVKCKTVREGYLRQLALKCPNTSVYKSQSLQSKSSCPVNGKTSTVFATKKPSTPPQICRPTRSISKNGARKERLKFERLPLTLDSDHYDVLPSNGWWKSETRGESTSDSEREAEVINETKSNSGLNVEIKNDNSDHCRSLDVCSSPESIQSLFSSVVLDNSNDGSETQTRAGSCYSVLSKIQGMQSEELSREASETSSFFHLTSGSGNENGIIMAPRPPQPTPETFQTCSENYSLSNFSRSTSLVSDEAIFGEDLELDYRQLFHYRVNTKSRIDYNKSEALKHNYSRPDKPLLPKEENSSQKYFDKCRKISCVFPNVNARRAKNSNAIPLVLQKEAVKRRPNTADIPVKLRLQHRSNAFTKFSKVKEENSTDERVLPTTLNKSADASYSVMTPYMANVVWSVMDDEKVV